MAVCVAVGSFYLSRFTSKTCIIAKTTVYEPDKIIRQCTMSLQVT